MEIRKALDADYDKIVKIWLDASVLAHPFVDPGCWQSNAGEMKSTYIPMSESWLIGQEGRVLGFYSLLDDYLAAIFLKPSSQGMGVGTLLLNHAKGLTTWLNLKVYKENKGSVEFYKSRGFKILSEQIDTATGAPECLMEWIKTS